MKEEFTISQYSEPKLWGEAQAHLASAYAKLKTILDLNDKKYNSQQRGYLRQLLDEIYNSAENTIKVQKHIDIYFKNIHNV